ncbi:MAG: DUF167 domain-containing protein [Rhodospirillaceae bacterium]|nr:DUF167 domain-containing protein [Rhodospirillaceae bacterium]
MPSSSTNSPIRAVPEGATVTVALTPKASRNAITGTAAAADGQYVLTARVTAAPESGKANAALIRLLSKVWNVPKSTLSIRTGVANRRKVVLVAGCGPALESRLNDWIADND